MAKRKKVNVFLESARMNGERTNPKVPGINGGPLLPYTEGGIPRKSIGYSPNRISKSTKVKIRSLGGARVCTGYVDLSATTTTRKRREPTPEFTPENTQTLCYFIKGRKVKV